MTGAYLRPATLDDALGALRGRAHVVLAGGTDVYPADAAAVGWGRPGIEHPDSAPILDISGVAELRRIERVDARVEIGALVTWTQIIASGLPAWFDGVRAAAREVGGRQIQNRGTLAGNLCNASPAADGVPALLALDARIRIERVAGARERREVDLARFILGNRRTCLAADELVTAIVIPAPGAAARANFLKLGARRYLVISIAMVAVCLEVVAGRVRDPRVAVGACSEVATRLATLEARLDGAPAAQASSRVVAGDFVALAALDDVRASAGYRRHAARVLVERALAALVVPADGSAPAAHR